MSKLISNWDEVGKLKAGDTLRILKTDDPGYLPVGFETKIKELNPDFVSLYDKAKRSDNESCCSIEPYEVNDGYYSFELIAATAEANLLIKTTVTKRKAAAKAIREAEEALMSVVNKGKSVGLIVSILPKLVITHQPDTETY